MTKIRVVEFYSGVGGMCMALRGASIEHSVVQALDVNNLANDVYRHNFPDNRCSNRVIESVTPEELHRWNADLWTMSPPCQPFSRLGNQRDTADNRTNSFLHLLQLLPQVRPKMLLLENVKGFETSQACLSLEGALRNCGYKYQRFLLSPLQFGISNARLRFYLLARLEGNFGFPEREEIHAVPLRGFPMPGCDCLSCSDRLPDITEPSANFEEYLPLCGNVHTYLDALSAEKEAEFLQLSDKELRRGFKALDIVGPDSRRTCCFTKRYTQFLEGTGSLLQTCPETEAKEYLDSYRQREEDAEALFTYAKSLQLRFFSSREVANFMSFPQNFEFPASLTYKQKIRLLGNSINVKVVSHLAHWLTVGNT